MLKMFIMKTTTYRFDVSNSQKLLFPASKITKSDLMKYYDNIADYILPYIKNRPLTMQRFPEGIGEKGFFQKNASLYFPDWIKTEEIRKVGGWVNHVICDTKETLLYLVNQYAITFHISLSTIDAIDYPDRLIFDLDPPEGDFEVAIQGAKALRKLLENDLGFKTFLMVTGSKGLHVVIPLLQRESFNEVHAFAKAVSNYIAKENPDQYTTAIRKNKRKGRLYIDYLRNSYAQTSVAPFSIRAIENAPVATPISWTELENKNLNPQHYTIKNIFNRLEKIEDPWKSARTNAKSICRAQQKLKALVAY
jgi:bifunctional non-homologous end joining protein LigD